MADAGATEALGDALLLAGAMSVSVEDADADSEREEPLFAEPGAAPAPAWRQNRLRVLLGPDRTPQQILAQVASAWPTPLPPIVAIRTVGHRDWVRASQAQFAPMQIGRLWVVPSWSDPPDPEALNLRLDPGLAFGTGTHPSTRLCLQWLQAQRCAGQRVLDYGCGSGILAIAAAKLGARAVHGVDIDPLALQAARENSHLNAVLADYTAPESLALEGPQSRFDVIVANILANPLVVLAPVLLRHLAPGGSIALAGVLARQAPALLQAYRATDARLALSVWQAEGEWVCLAGRRSGH